MLEQKGAPLLLPVSKLPLLVFAKLSLALIQCFNLFPGVYGQSEDGRPHAIPTNKVDISNRRFA